MSDRQSALEEDKVRSLLVRDVGTETIQLTYDEIYRHEEVWRRRIFMGRVSLIIHLLGDTLRGKRILDAGSGGGKLALTLAREARWVDGLDLSAEAIRVARLLADLSHIQNVAFIRESMEELPEEPRYDCVTLIGTLEHVMDPVLVLRKLAGVLKPEGTLVVECPGFLNFRGDIYMTMLTLMGLPMSLADLRQVDYQDLQEWAGKAALLVEKVCGYAYALGWLEKAVEDMMKRIPLAIRDKGMQHAGWDVERLRWWMEKRLPANRLFIDRLRRPGILKRIPETRSVEIDRSAWKAGAPSDVPSRVWEALEAYLDDSCDDDPYYCITPPYCYFGGGTIYQLRKQDCGAKDSG